MKSILETAARAGGKVLLAYFHTKLQVKHKGTYQVLVTEADTKAQDIIQNTIVVACTKLGIPEEQIGFIGEENLETKQASHMFVIDPLDGTSNFASGLDYFCVSIAHFSGGVLTDAVVYWPVRDILYCATRGKGAWKKVAGHKSVQLQVKNELLENSMVLTYISAVDTHFHSTVACLRQIAPHVRGIRAYGSTCLDLAQIADSENAAHIMVSTHSYLWDIAGPSLIISESGGVCSDLLGNKIELDITSKKREFNTIAGHPNVVKSLLSVLTK